MRHKPGYRLGILWTTLLVLGFLLLGGAGAIAQIHMEGGEEPTHSSPDVKLPEYTQEDIETFTQIARESKELREKFQKEQKAVVDNSEMGRERYEEIQEKLDDMQSSSKLNVTQEEWEELAEINRRQQQIFEDAGKEMVRIVLQKYSKDREWFYNILKVVRHKPEIKSELAHLNIPITYVNLSLLRNQTKYDPIIDKYNDI